MARECYEPTITTKRKGGVKVLRIAKRDANRLLDAADVLERVGGEMADGDFSETAKWMRARAEQWTEGTPTEAPEQSDATK